ncbi:MAG TPA: UDP-N-acetylmuramoyl-tripeptide--D-alanyl-D-alanine ligase [Bacillales bacterium]|nr:UDP-N-acetylmuramoyl-tripeptide--D-alanyl-D-alanine ligase [Bacillales bacterium]
MKWTRNELLELFPSHHGDVTSISAVTDIFTDSRKHSKNGLFIPIVGERFDGHDFLQDAIKQGASAALWQINRPRPDDIPNYFPLLLVDDTLEGLQRLAKDHLKKVSPIVVAVTGSNGKTTTKDIVDAVLSERYRTHKTDGNFNNHIGLPLTLLAMPEDCEAVILEMGMNHFGEISALSLLAQPDAAVITNIGESHIEFLGSREGIAKAKMEIVEGLKPTGKVIYDGDEPLLSPLKNLSSVSCGYFEENLLQIASVESVKTGFAFSLRGEETQFQIPVLGRHNVKNASFAIAVARELGLSEGEISNALRHLSITKMRFEQLKGQNGTLVINDAYNASPTSMKAAIGAICDIKGYNRRVLVLGDMYELGTDERTFHESVAEVIKPPITDVFTVGNRARWIAHAIADESIRVSTYDSKEEIVSDVKALMSTDTVVLFKASRAVGLETVVNQLTYKE